MTLLDAAVLSLLAFIGGIVIGFLLLLLRGANVTSRPMRALRRRLLGRSWQPVLMEPSDVSASDIRSAQRKAPSNATR